MAIPFSTVKKYAPIVKFHKDEEYFPMDPLDFIKQSRFRHHRGFRADQGYDKKAAKWIGSKKHDKSFYDIQVDYINNFRVWRNGENRRPRDSNSGDHWNVFLETRRRERGKSNLDSSVPVYYYVERTDTSKFSQKEREQFQIPLVISYKIQYWWFFGFNDGPAEGNHQGDWEHISVKLSEDKSFNGVYFSAHGEPKYKEKKELKLSGSQTYVYVAKGTHASYEKAGEFKYALVFTDNTSDDGNEWNTELSLKNLRDQPWRHFAGAWGNVGKVVYTTGPLGPWHKRHKN